MSSGVGDVGGDGERLAAGLPDFVGHALEPVEAPRADGHRRAVARKPESGGASDTGRCAGDRATMHDELQ